MSKILSRAQTDEMSIAFARGWRGPYGEQGAMEADFDKCLYSHELLLGRVEKLERVARAARARHEVWSRETYVEMDDALAAFDNQETGGAR